nr:uncharacterized protein LOC123774155 [Procambarus clarkii]
MLINQLESKSCVGCGGQVVPAEAALRQVLTGRFSFISYKNFVIVIVASHYTDARGNTPFYISKDIPMFSAFGWCIRKGAPFRESFTRLMARLHASGIITWWSVEVMAARVRAERKAATLPHLSYDEDKQVVLSLDHMQGAFYLLLGGSCVALLTLLGETILPSHLLSVVT